MNKPHVWTDEHIKVYEENYRTKTYQQITDLINEKFNLSLSKDQVRHFGRKNNMTTRFNPYPFKKGNDYWRGGVSTQFKKGETYIEYPLGTERVNKEGYLCRKVSMTGNQYQKWKPVHRILWEEEHGEIPKGHIIVFLNGDKSDLRIDNLELVSRSEHAVMNVNKWYSNNANETKIRIIQARLTRKRAEREREL